MSEKTARKYRDDGMPSQQKVARTYRTRSDPFADVWGDVQQRMRDLALTHPDKRHALLSLTANAQEVSPDKQGRILIAERLRSQVGISEEVRLVGALDRIELWNPETFSRAVDDADGEVGDIAAGLFV